MGREGELEARLNHLLTLADRLPHGDSENHVRRCVCELIEAEGGRQSATAMTLVRSITQLQHQRELGLRRSQQTGAVAVDRLLAALCEGVAPLLHPFAPAASLVQGDAMAEVVPTRETEAAAPFNEDSWNRWKARGRAEDLVMRGRMRLVAVFGIVLVAGTTFWMI